MSTPRRYTDNPRVKIDPAKVPAEFRHLIPLAKEWSIGDDIELEAYIEAASDEKKKEFTSAFAPHFAGLQRWSEVSAQIVPQPDEVVLFDTASKPQRPFSVH